ncbi:MAG: DUF4349 domain-containing protein [Actinobacteria bacterium]|nr:DUF4349 domain-containing protein [Actinomycetota bacterium]
MTRKRWICVVTAACILLVLVTAAVLGCGEGSQPGLYDTVDESLRQQADTAKSGWESGTIETLSAEMMEEQDAYAAGGPSVTADAPVSSTLPQLQLMVIKTALMEMETAKGDYAKIREDAVAITSAAGGYVEGESASRDDEGLTYATLTLRIPADKFDGVVAEVSALGEVVSTQVSTNDVSAEYVDLESRLRHLQAEEEFYLSLIAEAQTVQEMITIREHLNSIQLEKEQVQGRINFLDQQVGFSTLTLSVDEKSPDEEDVEGFWASVGDAFINFGRGLKKLGIGFFYALPYLVILAVIAMIVWLLVRRSRRRGTPGEQPDVG